MNPWRRAVLAEARAALLEGQLAEARAQCTTLTDQLLTLKREGFVTPTSSEPMALVGSELPTAVLDAIAQRARPGTETWSHLAKEAEALTRAEANPELVAARILEGDPFDWG